MGRFIPDASTRTAAMENGEVLYAAYNAIPNIDAVRLKDRDDIDVTTKGYSMINPMALIEFNTKEGAFVDPAIRRAISTAIDRRFMIDTIFFGYGKPATVHLVVTSALQTCMLLCQIIQKRVTRTPPMQFWTRQAIKKTPMAFV